jgi:hypothetical protein
VPSDEFPADVGKYISEQVDSVAQLEVLLLLRSDPARVWTAEDVSGALKLAADHALGELRTLVRQGVAEPCGAPEGFCFAPQTNALRELLDAVAQAYDERRVTLITMIYSKPVDKVRTFADAFRLRKES